MDQLIKEMRKAIKDGTTTVPDLADAAGVSRMQIYRIMDQENDPSTKKAQLIAEHLGFSILLTPS